MKKQPQVDDADVDRIVDHLLHHPKIVAAKPEDRGEVGYRLAILDLHGKGFSEEYEKALAQKVRERLWWRTSPSS